MPDSADQVKQKIEDPDAAITLDGEMLDSDVGQVGLRPAEAGRPRHRHAAGRRCVVSAAERCRCARAVCSPC
ncbi:MAG: Osmosensitive K+ channel histidine kinase KdpD [uncultured Paraburkholderia sp.]|nr:MAG: Osmosensitive K+ channel histidine kinase KdpD [uncultured Paraburkholderia sp.]